MENFVADEAVQTKFLSVAQGRPGFSQLSYDQRRVLFIMIGHYFEMLVIFQLRDPWILIILWRGSPLFSSQIMSRITPRMYCT